MTFDKKPLNPDHDILPKVPPGEVPIPAEGEQLLEHLFEEEPKKTPESS